MSRSQSEEWMLPAPPVPKAPSSVSAKGSSRGSISALKRKTCEGAGASASQHAARGVSVSPASSSAPSGSEPKVSTPSEDVNQVVGIESDTPTPPPATHGQTQAHGTADIVHIDDGEEGEAVGKGSGKKKKKCTSIVWNYFTKKIEVVEVNGKNYEQLWGYCNFPNCKQKYRAECNYGTNGFRNHLKSAHSVVKGQLQLKVEKEHGKDVTNIQAFSDATELDKYMADSLLKQSPFDILAYWKNKTAEYPILSQIARDMMAIQVSTVASESAFSAVGRVVDPYRNRLASEMVRALICTKDWIHATRKDFKYIPSIVADLKEPDTIPVSPNNPMNDDVEQGTESDPDVMNEEDEL